MLTGDFPLTLLAEGEDTVMLELFRKMFDAMGIFGAVEIFTDLSAKYQLYAEHLMNYHRQKRPTQTFLLEQAPYAEVFIHGFEMANRLATSKVLYIPRSSIARYQTRRP
jgi:hypothetical protein